MTRKLIEHKDAIKAAILAGETYKVVAERYGVFQPEIHTLLRRDPDIVAAKAAGELRVRGRTKLTLEECLADPAVADVISHGMSTNAAAVKHGISQPTLWAKVKRAKDLIQPPTSPAPKPATSSGAAPSPVSPVDDLDFLVDIVRSYAARTGQRPESVAHQLMQHLAD